MKSRVPAARGHRRQESYLHRRVKRLVCSIALLPLVWATAFTLASIFSEILPDPPFDSSRIFQLSLSTLAFAGAIVIWRSVIHWTRGRTLWTGIVSTLPLAQAIYAASWWDIGCASDLMAMGQEGMLLGIWVWMLTWFWFGGEFCFQRRLEILGTVRRLAMTRLIRCTAAGIGLVPFVVGLFWMTVLFLDNVLGFDMATAGTLAYSIMAIIAVAAWLCIWKSQIVWSGKDLIRAILAAVILLGAPILLVALTLVQDWPMGIDVVGYLPMVGWGLWMMATMWIWNFREPPSDFSRFEPLCGNCKYPLKGLTHTQCPECGFEPTLDELWRATHQAPPSGGGL